MVVKRKARRQRESDVMRDISRLVTSDYRLQVTAFLPVPTPLNIRAQALRWSLKALWRNHSASILHMDLTVTHHCQIILGGLGRASFAFRILIPPPSLCRMETYFCTLAISAAGATQNMLKRP